MPEEFFVLLMLSVLSMFSLTLVKMILNHKRSSRSERVQQSESGSLTTSELESMMRRAVEQSVSGLSGKIENLELEVAKLSASKPMLAAHNTQSRLELEDEVVDVDSVPVRNKTKA